MKIALGWGGGVGSLLALDALGREGHDITLLHLERKDGLPGFVVEAQAAALGLPLRARAAGDDELSSLAHALPSAGVERFAVAYLRGEEHVGWKLGKLTRAAGVEPMLPVRHVRPDEAARTLAESGARLFVWSVSAPLPRDLLGRFLDPETVDEIEGAHGRHAWSQLRTLAVDGPRFRRRVDVTAGEVVPARDGWRLDLGLAGC